MEEREELKRNLGMLDVSLVFLLLVILSILLSLQAALLQREQLELTLKGGDPSRIPPVEPVRLTASAIMIGCLGYFLCLALVTQRETHAGNDPSARQSAQVNTAASLLVLLAAILRLTDLKRVARERQTPLLEVTTLPD